jgi:hypothetical protein
MDVFKMDDIFGSRFDAPSPTRPRIGALKIDIEGYELEALRGGTQFLRKANIPFIISEIGIRPVQETVLFLDFLTELGYEVRIENFVVAVDDFENLAAILRRKNTLVNAVCFRRSWLVYMRQWRKDPALFEDRGRWNETSARSPMEGLSGKEWVKKVTKLCAEDKFLVYKAGNDVECLSSCPEGIKPVGRLCINDEKE